MKNPLENSASDDTAQPQMSAGLPLEQMPPIQPSPADEPGSQQPKRRLFGRRQGRVVGAGRQAAVRSRKSRIIRGVITAVIAIVLVVGGWLGYKFIRNALKATNGNLLSLLEDSKLDGESTGRVNILLAGNSSDDPGHGGAELTDSIIIMSIGTADNTAFILSIPRDTWVNVPGYGHQKINSVYPEGGMDLLEQVVEKDFGVTINYHTLVNYTAFKQAVDAVGGITVTIKSPDPRGIYDPNIAVDTGGAALKLTNGQHTLDGQTALALARARNDPVPANLTRKYGLPYGLPGSDFDRAANQRLMLVALKDKAGSLSTLTNPVKISQLLDAVGDNVKTNFSAANLRRLAALSKKIPSSSIQSASLQDSAHNINLLANYTSSTGQAALIPAAGLDDFSDIQHHIRQLTSNDPVVKENATIVVLNGSGVSGRAKSEAATLEAKNLNVSAYANAPATVSATQIVAVTTNALPATVKLLETELGIKTTTTNAKLAAQYPDADYIVVLGADSASSSTQ